MNALGIKGYREFLTRRDGQAARSNAARERHEPAPRSSAVSSATPNKSGGREHDDHTRERNEIRSRENRGRCRQPRTECAEG